MDSVHESGGTWMKAPGKLAELFLDYPAIAQARTNSMFARMGQLCSLPPKGGHQQNTNTHTSKMWPASTSFLARGTRPEETKMDICGSSKCSHRKQKGNPSCPCSVPSILSVRHDLGFVQLFSIKKVKLFSCHFILFTHIEKRPSNSFPN